MAGALLDSYEMPRRTTSGLDELEFRAPPGATMLGKPVWVSYSKCGDREVIAQDVLRQVDEKSPSGATHYLGGEELNHGSTSLIFQTVAYFSVPPKKIKLR